MSNLKNLNDVLFDTLEKVKNGTMDGKQSAAIVQLSNSIINNGKLQLAAHKFANSGTAPEMFGLPEGITKPKTLNLKEKNVLNAKDKHEAMRRYALTLDYNSAAEAIGVLGKTEFKEAFEQWLDEN